MPVAVGVPFGVPLKSSDLTTSQWAYSFALVTSLFFTWGFAYGLLDVLNAHFQVIFGIDKTQSTLLQFAYFGAYFFFAPLAGMFMRRKGYKAGIHLGLTLYSLGAVFFWPSAKFAKYGGFVGCTFVIGCGLSALEVAANSYIAVLGSQKYAAARLNFSQGFQGVASFTGPLIASRWFFLGENATKLDTVQWVYLAVAGLGVVLNVLFYFCRLPEIEEDTSVQTAYCGAQVGVASLAVNFMIEKGITPSRGSQLFSFCQMTFTFGRFVGVVVLNFVDPAFVLSFYAVACSVFSIAVALAPGNAGIGCLFMLFFFESICYPCIFTLATKNLGRHTKQGSGLVVMGVGGGAWYPPAQASVADRINTHRSYLVPFSGYAAMSIYAIGMVIDQARKDTFRFRNVHEKVSLDERENSTSEGSIERGSAEKETVDVETRKI
ncbi:MFS general substrate transporter [Panaeolus papilionaceus]|nr:MFS general substrate transporter [Panaeolus papilionaceus]